jgi:glycosyltransferase involved in cell wall biosynthesis
MCWFLEEIFPTVLEAVPDAQLLITGDHQNLPLPPTKNVTLTGFVDDIQSLIAQAKISIVPLLTGGGTRLKILEAMALRTAVVSTSKGAQGIEVTPEDNILIADTPEAFSKAVIRILKQPNLGEALATSGLKLVKDKYSPEAISVQYERLLGQAKQKYKVF